MAVTRKKLLPRHRLAPITRCRRRTPGTGKARFRVMLGLAASVVLLAAGGCASQSSTDDPQAVMTSVPTIESRDAFPTFLQDRIPELMDRYDIPGVGVAIVRSGQPVWIGTFGYADVESAREMTPDTICRAESISKSVTAWGVMKLEEQGRIILDESVRTYLPPGTLPVPPDGHGEISIRRLLSNSAGLGLGSIGSAAEYEPEGKLPPLASYITKEVEYVQPSGTGFMYSNTGFNLLQLVVEEVTGKAFADYMDESVLTPLGMHDSSYQWENWMRPRIAKGYERDGDTVEPYVYAATASGGLLTTVGDVARFVAAGMYDGTDTRISRISLNTIHTPEIPIPGLFGFVADSYGFGHFVEQLPNGFRAVWHGGQGHGWMTHFHLVPETGDGIVILTNSERSWPFFSHILTDWAQWAGLGSVKFGLIATATRALWWGIGAVLLGSLVQIVRLAGNDRWAPARRLAPLAPDDRWIRLGLFITGAVMVLAVMWVAIQPYSFIPTILSTAAPWLAATLVVAGMTVVASALMPVEKRRPRDSKTG